MEESVWYLIKYSIGYVYEGNKLVITIPVGILNSTKENFEKNLKLMDIGPYVALPSEAINIGDRNKEIIARMIKESPEDAVIIIDEIINRDTGDVLAKECIKAKKSYDSERIYLEKGYILKTLDEFSETFEANTDNIEPN